MTLLMLKQPCRAVFGGIKCVFRKQLYMEKSTDSGFTVGRWTVFHGSVIPTRKYSLFLASENCTQKLIMGSSLTRLPPL